MTAKHATRGEKMNRKKRKSIFDLFFEESIFEKWDKLFETLERETMGLEGGYSISVIQTPEGTKVHVKAGENVDIASLRRELESRYPGAEIVIEGGKPLIQEVSVKKIKEEKKKSKSILDNLFKEEKDRIIIEEDREEQNKFNN